MLRGYYSHITSCVGQKYKKSVIYSTTTDFVLTYGLWLVSLALSARFFLLRLFKMIFIMKKKHRKRCFGIAVCKFKEFRYNIGIFRQ